MTEADFDRIIATFNGEIANIGATLSWDAAMRSRYQRTIQQMASDLKRQVRAGQMTWAQAATRANEMRNVTMELLRARSSPVGRAKAVEIKAKGLTLNEAIARQTVKIHGPNANFNALSAAQKERIFGEVVEAAGRSNPKVNAALSRASMAGRGLIVMSLAISVYNIATAEDKGRAAVREGATLGGGIAGGVAGGALAGLFCGPGAPACVPIAAFVGGALGAFGVSLFF